MKLLKPLQIDMREFFLTGKFDCLALGQTQEWILANFPDPDWHGESAFAYRKNDIWRYGDLEFYFADGCLNMIYSDRLQNQTDGLDGGTALDLDAWILRVPKRLTLQNLICELNQNDADFEKYRSVNGWICLYLPASKIELCFSGENAGNPNDFLLVSFAWRERPLSGSLQTYRNGKMR
ncbi:hypothetical protein [Conchiformibius kuhniae]|uniref:Uncharacterized protein n=1 Tax=Conchiformibius kuhniae TaxID=211502 RepID=A0A8T9MVS0_9NEIS|nr:hypothetical protein [Conchiformibius kuhniae]UOP04945.1 hypothetical protein LVJ77_00910 [Conchiformibius kuhniae]